MDPRERERGGERGREREIERERDRHRQTKIETERKMNKLTEMVTYRLAEIFSFCYGSSQVRSYLPYIPGGQG